MKRARPGGATLGGAVWSRLASADAFAQVRTDAQLARLVVTTARRTRTPYAVLLAMLLGTRRLPEPQAREVWGRAVRHRRDLEAALGRPVHLRVAALDLVMAQGVLPRPFLVDPALVKGLLDEAASDPLTGLPNRRHLEVILAHELRQRRRPAVALLDVDGFKAVNDAHGHARGDALLRGLADLARRACRRGDVAARIGGDEFVLVLVDADEAVAVRTLERLGAEFERANPGLDVGLSYGVVRASEGEGADAVLAEADRRMYAAKRARAAGRGRQPGLALYATAAPDRLAEVQRALASEGLMVVPARTAEAARKLAALLAPALLLSDLLHPPRGGVALLEGLARAAPGAPRVAVAPRRWRAVGKGLPPGISVLPFPPSGASIDQLLRALPAGSRGAPQAPLGSAEEAAGLIDAVERLLAGATPAGEAAGARPELALLRTRLGR